MLQGKDRYYQTRFWNKFQLHSVSKKYTLNIISQLNWKKKDGKRCPRHVVSLKNLQGYINDKIDFKTRSVTRDKDGYSLMIRGSVHWEDIILNVTISEL